MALRVSVVELIERLGHDGSEKWWPELPEPFCRRAFHIQEMIWIAWTLGYTVTPFEAIPCSVTHGSKNLILIEIPKNRLETVMKNQIGVITGQTFRGQPHAVAWSGEVCYDPNGEVYKASEFGIQCFWTIKSR